MSTIIQQAWYEQQVETYGEGRVCAHPGCATVLSKYNPDPVCGAHQGEPDWRYLGHSFAVCESCGAVYQLRRRTGGLRQRLCGKCRQEAEARSVTRYRTCCDCHRSLPVTPFFWEMRTDASGETVPMRRMCRDCRSARQKRRSGS